jgi:hypothetical protein
VKTLARSTDQADILRRLRDVHPESARLWGRMSAPQMVCHLADAFRMALGQKPVSDVPGLLNRTFVKWMALYAPMRWPPGLLTRPEIDQLVTGTRPCEFATDVAQVEAFVALMTAPGTDFEWPSHPVFGKMSRRDWMRWGYLHMDHHLRQFGA